MCVCDSVNLVISAIHCYAVKGRVMIKRREVESSLSTILLCCYTHDVLVHCPAESQNVICCMFDSILTFC